MEFKMDLKEEGKIDLPEDIVIEIVQSEFEKMKTKGIPYWLSFERMAENVIQMRLNSLRKRFNEQHDFKRYVLDHFNDEEFLK